MAANFSFRKRLLLNLFRRFRHNEAKIHELTYLFWECTHRCNLQCLHCGSDCVSNSHTPDMPLKDFLKVLHDIKDLPRSQPLTVIITGGEPLLRSDLEQAGQAIRSLGFGWGIVSNGLAYSQSRHQSLLDAGMKSITISLDGLSDIHNWLRANPNSFEKALLAISIVAKETRLNADVVSCVNQRNIDQLEEMYQLLLSLGLKAWRLFLISPIGRAANNKELAISAPDFQKLMGFIADKRKAGKMDVKFSCEGYVGNFELEVRDAFFFCRAGINIGSVLLDGSIGACPNNSHTLVQGNIYTDKFTDVWEHRFEPYRNRSWTKTGICADCKHFSWCEGNGLHLRSQGGENPLICHYNLIK